MGCFLCPDPPPAPPAPDYAAAAQAQGQANLQSGLQSAVLSNPNIVSPYGNQTVTWDQSGTLPGGAPQATVTQTLTPQAQQTLEAQQLTQTDLAKLANTGATNAQSILNTPFQYTGPAINTAAPSVGPLNYGPSAGMYGLATGNLDLSNVAKMPVNAGTTAQQAILSRLDPEIQQSHQALVNQLANQGITDVNSEAYQNALRNQTQQENDLRTQAALQGINIDIGANQQGFNQALSQAGLYNQAVGQNFGQGATSAGLYNQAAAQQFNEGLAAAQFQNTAAQQALQQQLTLRNQPLNEITALESGSQIQNPQFQAYTGANVAAAPVFQAANAQGQYNLGMYGQQMAGYNAQQQGLGGLLGGVAGGIGQAGGLGSFFALSDRRLKSNVIKVGIHPLGVGIYEYDIDGRRERGVMAQELIHVKPEAVAMNDDGYLMVDYGQL